MVLALRAAQDSYGAVLALILATIISLAIAGDNPVTGTVAVALSGMTLLFALRTSAASERIQRLARAGVVVAVGGSIVALFLGGLWPRFAMSAIGILLAVLVPAIILRNIGTSARITFRLVLGALCVYLLIGLFYTYVFQLLEVAEGAPFFTQGAAAVPDFLYFSYVTLTTVGYGDLTASGNLNRIIAVSEALLGQLFLVSAVAVLAGNIGQSLSHVERGSSGTSSGSNVGPPQP
jgi:hypothetical protein